MTKTTDPWPFWYRRMQRREGRRAAAEMDYRAGLLPPRCGTLALLESEDAKDIN